jgi:hypothetical protein
MSPIKHWTSAEIDALDPTARRRLREDLASQRTARDAGARRAAVDAIAYLDRREKSTRESRINDARSFLYPNGR